MKHLFHAHINKFTPISLQELNTHAALLDREENKYILTPERLSELVPELVDNFRILQINDNAIFGYKSLYFDSDEFIGYRYHNQDRVKRRFKIRTRHYVDSKSCFFEIKLKTKRGGTIKRRLPYAVEDYGNLTEEARQFLQTTYQQVYGLPFTHDLIPRLEANCDRITLVSKQSSERMTIDFNLSFAREEKSLPVKCFVIIETKSPRGRGIADSIFKQHGIRSRNCSKYCLGINLLFNKIKYNRFKPLLKLYGKLPVYNVVNETETVSLKSQNFTTDMPLVDNSNVLNIQNTEFQSHQQSAPIDSQWRTC